MDPIQACRLHIHRPGPQEEDVGACPFGNIIHVVQNNRLKIVAASIHDVMLVHVDSGTFLSNKLAAGNAQNGAHTYKSDWSVVEDPTSHSPHQIGLSREDDIGDQGLQWPALKAWNGPGLGRCYGCL